MRKRKQVEESDIEPRLEESHVNRLSLPLNEDGSFDWESVRDTTKEKFVNAVLNSADALEAIGLGAGGDEGAEEAVEEKRPEVTEANVGAIIDKVNLGTAYAGAFAISKLKKHPFLKDPKTRDPLPMQIRPDVIAICAKLTPEQHKELDPRALALYEKYADKVPTWAKEHLDLIMLVVMFMQYQAANVAKMMAAQIQLDAQAVRKMQAASPPPKPADSDKASEPGNGVSLPQEGPSLEPGWVPPFLRTERGQL